MRSLPLTILFAVVFSEAAFSQDIQPQHGIGSGGSYKEPSSPYVARTPYTLRWTAETSYKLYGKENPAIKAKDTWTSASVIDAVTGATICSSPRGGMSGELKVPTGGKHRVIIYSLGRWTASFTEDEAMLREAARRGELKNGVVLSEARKTSLATKNEKVESLKLAMLKQMSDAKDKIGSDGVAALSADIIKAAHLASSEEDFLARFDALSAITIKRFPEAAKMNGDTKTVSSTWSGKGLPPGMQKR